jgi:hypothetical protein
MERDRLKEKANDLFKSTVRRGECRADTSFGLVVDFIAGLSFVTVQQEKMCVTRLYSNR